ncbi:uncharacterized protein N7482_000710 [Penicillium canariense]|uniref:Uncharacterized protein n=1 Tax=Penicillium canariense TaxID=189055 RepID=A0A9W9IBX8_9EURO|nr:uncharacterized protein N7482_000710 [Penicillium canariense]KAJ5174833.1 hypothetical protein N7482_000710 [Penicillium canariense]
MTSLTPVGPTTPFHAGHAPPEEQFRAGMPLAQLCHRADLQARTNGPALSSTAPETGDGRRAPERGHSPLSRDITGVCRLFALLRGRGVGGADLRDQFTMAEEVPTIAVMPGGGRLSVGGTRVSRSWTTRAISNERCTL